MSFVYFLECDGYIKVGVAVDVPGRIGNLQIGSPHEIKLLGVIPGDRVTEREFQDRLAPFSHRGEWFRGDGEAHRIIQAALRDRGVEVTGSVFGSARWVRKRYGPRRLTSKHVSPMEGA